MAYLSRRATNSAGGGKAHSHRIHLSVSSILDRPFLPMSPNAPHTLPMRTKTGFILSIRTRHSATKGQVPVTIRQSLPTRDLQEVPTSFHGHGSADLSAHHTNMEMAARTSAPTIPILEEKRMLA